MTQQTLPTKLPFEQSNQEDLLDWLHGSQQENEFFIGDSRYKITGPAATDRASHPIVFALTIDGAEAWVEAPGQLIKNLSAQHADIALIDVPDAYRGLFFEAILSDLLAAIEAKSDTRLVVSHAYDSTTAIAAARIFANRSQPDFHLFGFEIEDADGMSYPLGLRIGTATLSSLCRLLAHEEPVITGDSASDLLTAQCLYGMVNITRDALASLEPEDCLIVDKTLLQANFVTLLLENGQNAAGSLQVNQIHLTSELQETMEPNFAEPGPDEIQLSLIYGETRITQQDAADLKAGTSIDVKVPGSPIGVYADKQLIAHGRIVEIDNRLVVSIDELAA